MSAKYCAAHPAPYTAQRGEAGRMAGSRQAGWQVRAREGCGTGKGHKTRNGQREGARCDRCACRARTLCATKKIFESCGIRNAKRPRFPLPHNVSTRAVRSSMAVAQSRTDLARIHSVITPDRLVVVPSRTTSMTFRAHSMHVASRHTSRPVPTLAPRMLVELWRAALTRCPPRRRRSPRPRLPWRRRHRRCRCCPCGGC